jgi:D-serine dehydratase
MTERAARRKMATERQGSDANAAAPLEALGQMRFDGTFKGIPGGVVPFPLAEIGRQGWNLLRQDLPLPAIVLKRSALDNNAAWMERYLAQARVAHAPHGKTLVAPQIAAEQITRGAWGITVANLHQLQVYRRFGVRRFFFANQLVGRANVTYVLEELRRDPEFEFCCVVDSVPGVDALAQAVREAGCLRSLQVLVEVGFEQGRAGCRTVVEALEVARAARAAAPALAFRGVETYEGVIDGYSEDETLERVHDLLDKAADVMAACLAEGLVESREPIFCAGGSQ